MKVKNFNKVLVLTKEGHYAQSKLAISRCFQNLSKFQSLYSNFIYVLFVALRITK